jgi:hypothetical protein
MHNVPEPLFIITSQGFVSEQLIKITCGTINNRSRNCSGAFMHNVPEPSFIITNQGFVPEQLIKITGRGIVPEALMHTVPEPL